jgi:hypothetical protein
MQEGAALGTEEVGGGVPAAWVSLLNNGEEVLHFAQKLVEMRTHLMEFET